MKLVIDLGNTTQKLAVFSDDEIVFIKTAENISASVENIFSEYPISSAIIASVIDNPVEIISIVKSRCPMFILEQDTPVPVTNNYLTPETLGSDRLAAAVMGHYLYPRKNVLVIDAGTCIKYDFVDSQGVYHGGAISPGQNMRLKALHTFTGKLPLIELSEQYRLTGKNTEQSILSGVVYGAVAEIDGIINQYKERYPDLKVLLSGGDSEYLVSKLKSKIFAVSNIVLSGLKIILDYNDNIKQI